MNPQLKSPPSLIGDLPVPSYDRLLDEVETVEAELAAPFSVLIHGDLNLNNIIYNAARERVHFIDLHRSRETDYVQDISVLLVSAFRLPIFDQAVRGRLDQMARRFFRFTGEFARTHHDPTMEARLALALGRSYCTSARFELNRAFAKRLFQRSTYIFEKLLAHRGSPWSEFKLPQEVLTH